ncbi:MAG TPA: hypothetical protein VJZ91_02590, partial [Blastocatellia bacterium]|nr:hypothetical protein [Blastocatellia bacterium]
MGESHPASATLSPGMAGTSGHTATYPATRPATDAVNGQTADQSLVDPISINPLVLAFANSLAARGFEADNQGFIVTTMKGEVLAEHNADRAFNPAS